jgi:hypothetical protein
LASVRGLRPLLLRPCFFWRSAVLEPRLALPWRAGGFCRGRSRLRALEAPAGPSAWARCVPPLRRRCPFAAAAPPREPPAPAAGTAAGTAAPLCRGGCCRHHLRHLGHEQRQQRERQPWRRSAAARTGAGHRAVAAGRGLLARRSGRPSRSGRGPSAAVSTSGKDILLAGEHKLEERPNRDLFRAGSAQARSTSRGASWCLYSSSFSRISSATLSLGTGGATASVAPGQAGRVGGAQSGHQRHGRSRIVSCQALTASPNQHRNALRGKCL